MLALYHINKQNACEIAYILDFSWFTTVSYFFYSAYQHSAPPLSHSWKQTNLLSRQRWTAVASLLVGLNPLTRVIALCFFALKRANYCSLVILFSFSFWILFSKNFKTLEEIPQIGFWNFSCCLSNISNGIYPSL